MESHFKVQLILAAGKYFKATDKFLSYTRRENCRRGKADAIKYVFSALSI